MKLYYFSNLD